MKASMPKAGDDYSLGDGSDGELLESDCDKDDGDEDVEDISQDKEDVKRARVGMIQRVKTKMKMGSR